MRVPENSAKKILMCVAGVLALSAYPVAAVASSGPPQNAAFVYYQASLLASELTPPDDFSQSMTEFGLRRGLSLALKYFASADDFQQVMELTTAASKMSQCDWGLVPTWRCRMGLQVANPLYILGQYLFLQAKVFTGDGQYLEALKNALTIRRISRHLGDDTWGMWMRSRNLEYTAFDTIGYVLGKMRPDADTLAWLERELTSAGELQWQPRETLPHWRDWGIECWQASPELFAQQTELLLSRIEDPARKEERQDLTATQTMERARLACDVYIESALEILESDRPYQEKQTDLNQLRGEAIARANAGDPISFLKGLLPVDVFYGRDIYRRAYSHAIQAAIAIYRIKTTTGQLPQTLPAGLPTDSYSGKDFEYDVTDEGFVLRSRVAVVGRAGPSAGPRQFEFLVAN